MEKPKGPFLLRHSILQAAKTIAANRSKRPSEARSLKDAPAPRDSRSPQYLFDAWHRVAGRIQAAGHVVLFLDFDGTLVRLRREPADVRLGDPERRLLSRLAAHRSVTLCLISGRRLSDLRSRARIRRALYFGLHGWERSNGKAPHLPITQRLRPAMERLRKRVQALPGVHVENKGICFGVHYRAAQGSAIRQARAAVEETLKRLGPDFGLMAGKKIWEIYPKKMGSKGLAARELLRKRRGRNNLAIYAGDDTTDETAFALLRDAVTIRVGNFRETKAKFFLHGPAEMRVFLRKLEAALL